MSMIIFFKNKIIVNYPEDMSLNQIKKEICYRLHLFSNEFHSIHIKYENSSVDNFSIELKLKFFIDKSITVCFDLSRLSYLNYEMIVNNLVEKK